MRPKADSLGHDGDPTPRPEGPRERATAAMSAIRPTLFTNLPYLR